MAEASLPEGLSQTILKALGAPKLQGVSQRQLELMDNLLQVRMQNNSSPVSSQEVTGIYEMITEEVLPVSLPTLEERS